MIYIFLIPNLLVNIDQYGSVKVKIQHLCRLG